MSRRAAPHYGIQPFLFEHFVFPSLPRPCLLPSLSQRLFFPPRRDRRAAGRTLGTPRSLGLFSRSARSHGLAHPSGPLLLRRPSLWRQLGSGVRSYCFRCLLDFLTATNGTRAQPPTSCPASHPSVDPPSRSSASSRTVVLPAVMRADRVSEQDPNATSWRPTRSLAHRPLILTLLAALAAFLVQPVPPPASPLYIRQSTPFLASPLSPLLFYRPCLLQRPLRTARRTAWQPLGQPPYPVHVPNGRRLRVDSKIREERSTVECIAFAHVLFGHLPVMFPRPATSSLSSLVFLSVGHSLGSSHAAEARCRATVKM